MVNSGYFSDLGEGQVVIVDIKRFIPSSLGYMLRQLKLQGCDVILVTAEHLEYTPDISEVDEHHESDLERFKAFIFNSLVAIQEYGNANNIQLLLDNNIFNRENAWDFDSLMENCPFSKILIERLIAFDFIPDALNAEASTVVKPLLHIGNGEYINLIDGSVEVIENMTTYALGCSNLDSDFYNHLISLQNSNDLTLTFIMEGTPIIYGSSGLNVIDEFDLVQFGGWEADEATDLIEYIDPYVF